MDSDDSDEFNSFSEELALVKQVMVINGLHSSEAASVYAWFVVGWVGYPSGSCTGDCLCFLLGMSTPALLHMTKGQWKVLVSVFMLSLIIHPTACCGRGRA